MSTQQDRIARQYRTQQDTLANLLLRELRTLISSVFGARGPQPGDGDDLAAVIEPLVSQYGSAGAALAEQFYLAQREAVGLPDDIPVALADPPPAEQVQSATGWVLRDRQAEARARLRAIRERREAAIGAANDRAATIAQPDDEAVDLDDPVALARARRNDLEGTAVRMALQQGRRTVEDAIRNDPEALGWYRIARADACGFCIAMMGRGAVYKSEDSALYKAGTTEKYHDHCQCAAAARFRTDRSPLPDDVQAAQVLWYLGPAFFTGPDALNAMDRALRAQRAGRDIRAAVFDGPSTDPEKYRRQVTHDQKTVDEYHRRATRGARNGAPVAADNADDPRFT